MNYLQSVTTSKLGYPHELILFSLERAESIVKERYRTRVKLLSMLFLSLLGKDVEIVDIKSNDPFLKAINSLTMKSKADISSSLEYFCNHILNKIERFKQIYNINIHNDIINSLSDLIFVYIVAKEVFNTDTLKVIEVANTLEDIHDDKLRSHAYILKILGEHVSGDITEDILENLQYNELNIYITYKLSNVFKDRKNEFLLKHYSYIAQTMEEFKSLFKTESTLDDLILEKLFRTSIILYICGYMSAIRLPREEHANYIEKILSIPTVSSFIEDLLRDRVKVKIKGVKVELWLLPFSMAIFMILHEVHEFFVRDFTIPLFVISIPIHLPFAIPLFFLLTLGVSIWLVAITFNLNKALRNTLIEKIRRGN